MDFLTAWLLVICMNRVHCYPWWRHQMETLFALLALCVGNSLVTGEFPSQRPVICALNKRLSKQSWGWWFETPSRSLWRHCNATRALHSRSVMSMPTPVHVWYNFQLSMRLFIRQSNIPFSDISMQQDENTLWCLCYKNNEIDRYSDNIQINGKFFKPGVK